ncbi:hypothetical protein K9L97_04440 [Candidatus Woesearchaeota archaeon]|nr:hypothetical protein [Candidatus Woesearchaeota archaeon]
MANKKEDQQSKDEQIGFHKGSLSTLAKEREELARILGIVEQLMQMHIGALKDLGVDIAKQAQGVTGSTNSTPKTKKKPIEDIL